MKSNFTAQFLFASLTFCGTMCSPAMAQTYPNGSYSQPTVNIYPNAPYSQQTPGSYPGGYYPQQTPNYYPITKPIASTSTAFVCGRVGIYPATLVQANGRLLQSPLIVFQTESQNMTLEQRCNDVSQRMTRAVAQNGGKLSNLLLTTGKVNRQAVICVVNTAESCNPSNIILTLLKPENARNAGKVLARIIRFGHNAGGTGVAEGGGMADDNSVDIEPAAINLEDAVNQLASESGSAESGGLDGATNPAHNQDSGNSAPNSGASAVGGGI